MPESDGSDRPAGVRPAGDAARTTWGLTALAALTFASAFPPIGIWPLVVVAPVLLMRAATGAVRRRTLVLATWTIFAATWLVLDAWLRNVTVVGWPLFAAYMGLWPVMFALIARSGRDGGPLAAWPRAVIMGAAWGGLEVVRGVFALDGYPWYLLVHPLVERPELVQSADLLGGYATSAGVAFVAGGILDAWRLRRGAGGADRRGAIFGSAAAGVLLVAAPIHGALAMRAADEAHVAGPRVLVVQTNLPQDNKILWTEEAKDQDTSRWIQRTLDALETAATDGGPPVEAIIWPETMLPGFGFDPETRRRLREARLGQADRFGDLARQVATFAGVPFITGTVRVSDVSFEELGDGRVRVQRGRETNAVAVIPPEPSAPVQHYEKIFLTPFGETMPYISAWPWLESRLLALGARGMTFRLSRGDGPVHLVVPRTAGRAGERAEDGAGDPDGTAAADGLRIAAPICFEVTVPSVVHRLVHGAGEAPADVILNASNDGWFGASRAGRARHAQIARVRAIEHRRPVVRAVNSGYSMVIDSAGRVGARIGDGRYGTAELEATLLASIPLDGRSTVYGRLGPRWPWFALIALATVTAFALRRPRESDA